MSHLNNHHSLNNSILVNAAGVVVPPTSQLSADAHAALVAAANANRNPHAAAQFQVIPDSYGSRSMGGIPSQEEQQHHHRQLLLAHAAAEQRSRALHAARAHAAMAQRQEEDELLVRLLLHRRQQAAAMARVPGGGTAMQDGSLGHGRHGSGVNSFQGNQGLGPTALVGGPGPAGHLWGYGNVNASDVNAARLLAHRELQMMDRNALALEEARARQGLRTLAYIHPQTGLAMPSSAAGSAGLAALQGFQLHHHQQQGPDGMARAGPDGMARAGPDGMARAGPDGMARAGPDGMAREVEPHRPSSTISGGSLTADRTSAFAVASAPLRAPVVGSERVCASVVGPEAEDGPVYAAAPARLLGREEPTLSSMDIEVTAQSTADIRNNSKKNSRPADMPRRAFSAYNLFFADERNRILKELRNEQGYGSSVDEDSQEKRGESAAMALMSQSSSGRAKHKKSKVKCHDMAKQIGARWQSLSAQDKKYYQDLAAEDAIRQRTAMEDYRSKHGDENLMTDISARSDNIPDHESEEDSLDVSAKARLINDPSAPKKPGSAFLLFSNGRRKDLKRSYPELTNSDLSRMLSKMWKEAPDEVREHYLEKSRELGKHYKIEMGQWREKVAAEKKIKRDFALSSTAEDAESVQEDAKPAARKIGSKNLCHSQHDNREIPVRPELVSKQAATREVVPEADARTACAKADITVSDEEDSELAEEEHSLDSDDPEAPKKPETAFQAFANKRRKGLKLQYPFASEAEMSKMLSKTWRKCPQIIREKYLVEAEVRAEQYQVAHRKYLEQKNPVNGQSENQEDGTEEESRTRHSKVREEFQEDVTPPEQHDVHDYDEDSSAADGSEDDGSVPSQPRVVPTIRVTSTISDQIRELFTKSRWDALTLASRVVDLCRIYDWAEVEASTLGCYEVCRKKNPHDIDMVLNRAEAIETLRNKVPGVRVDEQRNDLVSDFIRTLDSLNTEEAPLTGLDNIGLLIRVVLESATAEQFKRIEEWSSRAATSQSLSLLGLFQAAEAADTPVECKNIEATSKCMKALGGGQKNPRAEDIKNKREVPIEAAQTSRVEDLINRRQMLIQATQGCEPHFTWSMPKAETESPALNEFLHSERSGPEEIIVGGGVEFAEHLASRARSSSAKILLKLGFSAHIKTTKNLGKHTTIVATKTKDLYVAAVNEYRSNMVELRNVCVELRELGVQVALLGYAHERPFDTKYTEEDASSHPYRDSTAHAKQESKSYDDGVCRKQASVDKAARAADDSEEETITSTEEETKMCAQKKKQSLPSARNEMGTKDGKKKLSPQHRNGDKEGFGSAKNKRSLSSGAESRDESRKEVKRKKKTTALEAMGGRFKRRRPSSGQGDEDSV